ncbi:hypothetical protein Tco_0545392 [Tanacetum coccineum]
MLASERYIGYMENYKNVSQEYGSMNAKVKPFISSHRNEVNAYELKGTSTYANPLALSQQSTRNRGKAIVNSSAPTYDLEPATVTEDEEMSKERRLTKLWPLISLSSRKSTNYQQHLRTSSKHSRANQDNSPRINRELGIGSTLYVPLAQDSLGGHDDRMKLMILIQERDLLAF